MTPGGNYQNDAVIQNQKLCKALLMAWSISC